MIQKWLWIICESNASAMDYLLSCDDETILYMMPRFLHPNFIDKYFSDILKTNNINHKKIVRKNMDLILKYYTNYQLFLIKYINVTNDNLIILDYFDDIVKNCNNYGFYQLIKNILYKYKNIDDFLKQKYSFMFQMIKNIDSNDPVSSIILSKFFVPLIIKNKCEEFDSIFKLLQSNKLDTNLINYIKQDISNYIFKIDDYKIVMGTYKNNYDIIDHYRINKSIIRKKIKLDENNYIYIEVDPMEIEEKPLERDIYNALDDLYNDGIIITNCNYDKIFGIINTEIPQNFKKSVTGIIETRGNNYSDTYIKKKVKLINKDYIYDKNCKTYTCVEKIN